MSINVEVGCLNAKAWKLARSTKSPAVSEVGLIDDDDEFNKEKKASGRVYTLTPCQYLRTLHRILKI